MGRHEQALPLYQRALAIREKALGPDHPSTATSLNNLAGLYRAMGRHEQALPLFQRALAIMEKALGPDHPSTATGLNNLAGLYEAMGRYEQALPLLQRALRVVATTDVTDFARESGRIEELATISANLGYFLEKHGHGDQVDEAIFHYKLSVNARQRLRAGARGLDKALRDSQTALLADPYRELARLLVRQGRIAEAEQVLLLLKESDLTDFLRRNGGERAAPETARWTPEEEQYWHTLGEVARRWQALGQRWEALAQRTRRGEVPDSAPEWTSSSPSARSSRRAPPASWRTPPGASPRPAAWQPSGARNHSSRRAPRFRHCCKTFATASRRPPVPRRRRVPPGSSCCPATRR